MMFPHFAKNRRINHPPSCKSSQWDRDDEYIRYSRYFQRKQYLKDNLPHLSACEWFCLGGHSVHSMHSLTVIQMAHIGKIGLKWQTSSKAKCHKPSLFFTSLAIFTSMTIFASLTIFTSLAIFISLKIFISLTIFTSSTFFLQVPSSLGWLYARLPQNVASTHSDAR